MWWSTPVPIAAGPLPERAEGGDSSAIMSPTGDDDFYAMRPYQEGDSLRRVHWKGVAKGQAMMSKQYGGGCAKEVWLDWHQLPQVGVEERLSRLCHGCSMRIVLDLPMGYRYRINV